MTIDIDQCIFFMLARASQAGTRFWNSCLTDLNITAVQAMVLNFLGQEDKVTSGRLSERTGLDGATLTGVLDRLEQSGLIHRQRHPMDRRALQITLSGEGRNKAALIQDRLGKANRDFMAMLSDDDQKAFRRMLHAVRTHSSQPSLKGGNHEQ